MQYRFLGPTGIKVSAISYGNWVNSNSKDSQAITSACVKQAWDLGINFFDTAEVYGNIQITQATDKLNDRLEWPCTLSTSRDITSSLPPNCTGANQKTSPILAVFPASTSSKASGALLPASTTTTWM